MSLGTVREIISPQIAEQRFADLGDLRVAYRSEGAGQEPVILIHGLCSMSYTWQETCQAMAAHRHTLALDLKGFGASDKPAGDYRLEAQAEIVRRLMDRLGIERAALIGNSMGGSVALILAKRHPHRVARLVLVDPAVYQAHARSQLARLLLGTTGRVGRELALRVFDWLVRSPALIENRMRAIYGRHEIITPERVAAYHSLLGDADCRRAIVATLQNWDLRPVERDLRLVRQPTLIVWGSQDRIVRPRFGRRLLRDLPRARLEIMPCGHAPQEEMPGEFARLVNDFLSE